MQYLYFEDWSQFIFQLDSKGIKHGNKIIKVYTSPIDPRTKLNDPNLKVIETEDSQLTDETFAYGERGLYKGSEIENHMQGLNEAAKNSARALFRFANRENLQFCQAGMSLKKPDGTWLINHPIEDIDSIEPAKLSPEKRSATIHLDIFVQDSLDKLAKLVDISPNSKELLDARRGNTLKKDLQMEINSSSTERK